MALTLAMPTGGDSPPMGWTPMPDPADGRVGSPPFPVNLTAEERAHLEGFDVLDFEVFSLSPGANERDQERGRPDAHDGVLALLGIAKAGES